MPTASLRPGALAIALLAGGPIALLGCGDDAPRTGDDGGQGSRDDAAAPADASWSDAAWPADAYVLEEGVAVWSHLHPDPVDRLRVTVLSGYQADRWALGEIEAFGTGAVERTDDDWYDLSQDVRVPPGTWHYRVAASSEAGTTYGPDQIVDVP